ncbi:uncharacterized protein LOC111353594 [Spodoptera litura]|uniref:Uncharacterized protein LOC111353594 n=1 Tax=Spodoptera litura TaxID=69820 RepID=A0A9J7E154_SPOLT|nr:uncharacterized protein LOC111353594 [Spodoptera litura]
MERFGALCFVLTFVSVCQTVPQDQIVTAVDGRLGIGQITGGKFGPGSFSIGAPGQKIPSKFETEDGEPVAILKPKPHRNRNQKPTKQQDRPNIQNMEDNADINPDKHQKVHVESGHGGKGGEGGKGGGQITIGKVVIANNNENQENKRKNDNQQPVTVLEAISSNNGPINMSKGKPASIAMKPITEGHIEAGAMRVNNQNVRPGNNIPKKTFNNFNNEGAGVTGHGSHDNGNDKEHVYTGGPNERWVWQ